LGKKLYSHCLSHPAVKLGTYCIVSNQGIAEKQLSIADVVIPVEKSQKKTNKQTMSEYPLVHLQA